VCVCVKTQYDVELTLNLCVVTLSKGGRWLRSRLTLNTAIPSYLIAVTLSF